MATGRRTGFGGFAPTTRGRSIEHSKEKSPPPKRPFSSKASMTRIPLSDKRGGSLGRRRLGKETALRWADAFPNSPVPLL